MVKHPINCFDLYYCTLMIIGTLIFIGTRPVSIGFFIGYVVAVAIFIITWIRKIGD